MLGQAFNKIIENRVALIKALVTPFIFYLAFSWINFYLEESGEITLMPFLKGLVFYVALMVFAVTTFRMVLLGPDSVPEWGLCKWTMRETQFILHVAGMGLIMMGIWFIGTMAIIPIEDASTYYFLAKAFIAVILVVYIWGRLALVFPAIAIDKRISLIKSWEDTEGLGGLMMQIVAFPPFLGGILIFSPWLFVIIWGQSWPVEKFIYVDFICDILSGIVKPLIMVLTAATLSLAYRNIYQENSPPDPKAPQSPTRVPPQSTEPS